jgi:glycosyltransferase involved in cell wall biosynthesis
MPIVSVIVPNYNHSSFLKRRLDSIFNQSFQDFEVIILDDFSSDNSRQIIDLYREHPKVSKIIYNEQNSGSTFFQWKKGLSVASGRYIWIAESDDYSTPDFLDTMVAIAERHNSAGLIYCNSYVINESDEFVHLDDNSGSRYASDYFNSGRDECINYLIQECIISNASSVLMRKEILDSIHFSFEKFRLAGDWMFYIHVLLRSDIYYVSSKLNYFRTHSGTVRSKVNNSQAVYERTLVLQLLINNGVFQLEKANKRIKQLKIDARKALNYQFSSKNISKIKRSFIYYLKTIKLLNRLNKGLILAEV